MRSRFASTVVGLALLALASASAPASAQTSAAAEAAFDEGLALYEAKDYDRACPKLKAAVDLAQGEGVGGMLLLADCYAQQGKTASAWSTARAVVALARLKGQAERAQKAADAEAALAPRLHRVALRIGPAVAAIPGVEVRRDGEVVPREVWAIAAPADPGRITIAVTAPGRIPWSRELSIPGEAGSTEIAVQALELAGASAPAPLPSPTAPPTSSPRVSPDVASGTSALGVAGIVVAAAGVVALGVSTGLAVDAKSRYEAPFDRGECAGSSCTDTARGEVRSAQSQGDVATGVFVGGAIGLAAGVVLFAVDRATGSKKRTGLSIVRAVGSGSIALGATW